MPDLIGKSLGRYHILEQLGEGGMAIVYKAYDTRLERDVAVKVIRTEKLTLESMERTLKRFEREAKALAKLTHPNIVPITDYGEHEGKPYLVMPYLPGGTLKEKLGKPIAWEESVRLLIPIARALAYAHEQGIIHRDVKPSNILITHSGEPMLTDFGIAKILLNDEETADLTGTGMGIGTPEYMAPEQWRGRASAQSDIYSLGVVLYEMVTGCKPFVANTPVELLLKQAAEPLPSPRMLVPNLPDAVEHVLFKALAKEEGGRYENAAAFVGDMAKTGQALLEGTATNLLIESKTIEIPKTPTDKRKPFNWAKVAVPIVILAFMYILLFSNTQSQKIASTTATAQAYTSTQQVQQFLLTSTEQTRQFVLTSTEQSRQSKLTTTAEFRNSQASATAQQQQIHETATAQIIQRQATNVAQSCLSLIGIPLTEIWNTIYCDQFDQSNDNWSIGPIDNEYLLGGHEIANGKLLWSIEKAKQNFTAWEWPNNIGGPSTDFFVSVEIKSVPTNNKRGVPGIFFRGDNKYYVFEVDDFAKTYFVLFWDGSTWKDLIYDAHSDYIKPSVVNRLAVKGVRNHLEFYINDKLVNTLEESQGLKGYFGLILEIQGFTGTFEFDNFVLRIP
jgi:serine/threonine protein kinase